MEFNIQKFLVENKLTRRSFFSEDDNTGAMLKTGAEQDEMSDEEDFGDEEPADDWYKAEPDSSDEFEKEPTRRDISKEKIVGSGNVIEMERQLKQLEDKKDELLNQWKIGKLTTSEYKQAIQNDPKLGNIPTEIKKLRADIEKTKTVSLDDEEADF